MSDEKAPKLRLKPRLPADAASASETPPPPPPSPEPAAPAAAEPRVRPRLILTPLDEAPAAPQPPPAEALPEPPFTPVVLSAPSPFAPPPPAEPSSPPLEASGPAAAFVPPSPLEFGQMPAPFEPPTAPAGEAAPSPLPDTIPPTMNFPAPVAHFPAPPGATGPETPAFAPAQGGLVETPPAAPTGKKKAKAKPQFKRLVIFALGGALLLSVLIGGWFLYVHLSEPPPPPPRVVRFKPLPVMPVEKPTPKPAEPAEVEPKAPKGPPLPSVAFRAWVQDIRISGLRNGPIPRVFIEHTAYSPGDVVNPYLGVVFDSYDNETKLVRFRDRTGATVDRAR